MASLTSMFGCQSNDCPSSSITENPHSTKSRKLPGSGLNPKPQSPPLHLIQRLDSVVRHVRRRSAVTYCFSGATVADILDKIPRLLVKHLYARNVIIYISGDQPSEIFQNDFSTLLYSLHGCDKHIFISGPIPPLGRPLQSDS